MQRSSIAIALLLTGCAAHSRQATSPRVTLGYTDRKLFAVMHFDAISERDAGHYGYAGRVAGRACGVDINFNARYHGSSLRLDGFVKNLDRVSAATSENLSSGFQADRPSNLEVRDRHTSGGLVRTIEGSIGGGDFPEISDGSQAILIARLLATPPHHEVELSLSHDSISGTAGWRHFDLHAEGDNYEGKMTFAGHELPFRLKGRGALWSMPAADQAAILPFVITCISDERRLVQEVDLGYVQ